ncbi:hypothetical protein MLD52_20330 [Puniceicoccaceae bacterium K14]|nr:hypothetical protein [Puniceicoccaceae bacterium K14]
MSTERIKMIVTLNVGQGNPTLFTKLSKELAESVESNEPSTMTYEWYMDDAAETCYLVEAYPNSDALLSHLENVGARLGPIIEAAPLSELLVLGTVSEKAEEVLSGFGAKIVPLHAGFQR